MPPSPPASPDAETPEVEPHEVTWRIVGQARATLAEVRGSLGNDGYAADRDSLKRWLCKYASTTGCRSRTMGISPIGATRSGGHVFKVRWNYPGQGKRGGLRLIVIAYCERRRVLVAGAWFRKDNPTDAEVEKVISDVEPPPRRQPRKR